ncbi:phage tail spike protein [Gemella sp. zg-1178]|uniref:phage tail spike protein n=1 Tax=Gemella sp. zg-1178 TaxID=2840372 RepID=UPI001C03E447|nr:phage tail spike protein [Gemella sp. zg-1178]MBU0279216.1 phage tail protein [Gemella sp. zg-1178]
MISLFFERDNRFFDNRGWYVLNDCISCVVSEDLNGRYELNLIYPSEAKQAKKLKLARVLRVPNYKGDQLFRIKSIVKDLDTLKVYATHIFYDLAGNFIEDIFIRKEDGSVALNRVLSASVSPHTFTAISDINIQASSRLVRKNTVQAIMSDEDNSLISRWGGELDRDNFRINWLSSMGTDKGVTIKYRKNLTGLEFKEDYSGLVTHIMPKGFDGLLIPEKYVVSPLESKYFVKNYRVIEYPDVISEQLSPDNENKINHEEALQILKERARYEFEQGLDKPEITCEVSFADLSKTREYKDYAVLERVYLGDTLRVVHKGFEVATRVVGYSYDCLLERFVSLRLSSKPVHNYMVKAINRQASLETKLNEVELSAVDKAKEALKTSLNQGMGSNIRYYKDKIYIMDTDSEKTARVIWKFDVNGLSVSTTGINGDFRLATSSDGQLFAEIITGLRINADMIEAGSIDVNNVSIRHGNKEVIGVRDNKLFIDFSTSENFKRDFVETLKEKISQIVVDEDGILQTLKNTTKDELAYIEKDINYLRNRLGSDGTIEFSKNRLLGDVNGTSRLGENFVVLHNGDGFKDNTNYTLSFELECQPYLRVDVRLTQPNRKPWRVTARANNPLIAEVTSDSDILSLYSEVSYRLSFSSKWYKSKVIDLDMASNAVSGGLYNPLLEYRQLVDGDDIQTDWDLSPEIIFDGGGV